MDLAPGQVTTINLHPRFHTTLQFPVPIARIDAGDGDVFTAELVGNKVMLKAIEVDVRETSMTIILADEQQTLVPYLIRTDSTQPYAYVVRFDDPATKHLNQAETQIAARLSSNVTERVATLAEETVQQRLLFKSGTIVVDRSGEAGSSGERVGLVIEDAEQMPGASGEPRLYIRYRILNDTRLILDDAHFVVRLETERRRMLFFGQRTELEVAHEDVRSVLAIPPGAAARGMLILDGVRLEKGQSLSVEIAAFQGRRNVRLDRILVGSDH